MELLHECQGEFTPLELRRERLPRTLPMAALREHVDPLSPLPVPYYESYECRDCLTRILIAK